MAYQPKSYRKFVATAATATLVASAIAPVAGAASNFEDVAPKYKDAVDYLVNNNITQGTSATLFGTHDNIKRGDLAIWLAKALKLDTASAPASGFEDTAGTRYDAAVSVLKAKGIVSGKSETSYAPSAYVTRGEMAIMLSRAYDLSSDTKAPFSDMGAYSPYINGLYAYEITTGKTAETFGTALNITRGDLAIFLKRAAEVVKTPEVVSVSAASAKRVEVKFNQPIDPETLFADGESGSFHADADVSLTTLTADNVPAGALSGELSADGKTLTIATTNAVSKRYDVLIDGLKTTAGTNVEKFSKVVTFAADTTAPVIVSTSKPTAGTVKVVFSEPLSSLGTVSYKLANGTVITPDAATGVQHNFGAGGKSEVTFTLGSEVPANGSVTATFIGAQDLGGNLLTPNPATVTLFKGAADGVAPVVASVNQTSATKFAVKFSEELQGLPTVTVNGAATSVVKDSADTTKYIVTASAPLDGASTVVVSAFTDLSGVAGTTDSRVVTFVKDAVAPKLASSAVVVDSTNRKEYLEFTFDKDVALSTATVTGTGDRKSVV